MKTERPLQVTYSAEGDALYLYLGAVSGRAVAKSSHFSDDVILDFDEAGKLIGVEILDFKASDPDISGIMEDYGLDPSLTHVLNTVRSLIEREDVREVDQRLVLA